jgi:glycerol-3-phosphate dehydrogenase (NAD(P)+)
MRAAVIGSGSFGTALANTLATRCTEVRCWAREPAVVEAINTRRENAAYLPGIPLSPRIKATTSMEEALPGAELVVVATPSHATRDVMRKAVPWLPEQALVVTVSKGIENDTLLTMTQLLADCLPESYRSSIAILSGPSFAKEMAAGMPTVVTIASRFEPVALRIQAALQTETFRTYTSTDVIGVEIGGALKNVIAIAAGVVEGLGLGHNALAALITRGLAEITRLACAAGAQRETTAGLSGLGDLVLTCTGSLSRNRHVGVELAHGRRLADVLAGMKMIAEGVNTTNAALALGARYGVELPIATQMAAVLDGRSDVRTAVEALMLRRQRAEN